MDKAELAIIGAHEKRTIMDGDRVIEVLNAGAPAWIAGNRLDEGGNFQPDSITFELHKAYIFSIWYRARDTVSRLRCGYPQWNCREVRYTEKYRMKFAKDVAQELALPGRKTAIPLIKSGDQNGQG